MMDEAPRVLHPRIVESIEKRLRVPSVLSGIDKESDYAPFERYVLSLSDEDKKEVALWLFDHHKGVFNELFGRNPHVLAPLITPEMMKRAFASGDNEAYNFLISLFSKHPESVDTIVVPRLQEYRSNIISHAYGGEVPSAQLFLEELYTERPHIFKERFLKELLNVVLEKGHKGALELVRRIMRESPEESAHAMAPDLLKKAVEEAHPIALHMLAELMSTDPYASKKYVLPHIIDNMDRIIDHLFGENRDHVRSFLSSLWYAHEQHYNEHVIPYLVKRVRELKKKALDEGNPEAYRHLSYIMRHFFDVFKGEVLPYIEENIEVLLDHMKNGIPGAYEILDGIIRNYPDRFSFLVVPRLKYYGEAIAKHAFEQGIPEAYKFLHSLLENHPALFSEEFLGAVLARSENVVQHATTGGIHHAGKIVEWLLHSQPEHMAPKFLPYLVKAFYGENNERAGEIVNRFYGRHPSLFLEHSLPVIRDLAFRNGSERAYSFLSYVVHTHPEVFSKYVAPHLDYNSENVLKHAFVEGNMGAYEFLSTLHLYEPKLFDRIFHGLSEKSKV